MKNSKIKMSWIIRTVSLLIGILMIIWAYSDDGLISVDESIGYAEIAIMVIGFFFIIMTFCPLRWNINALILFGSAALSVFLIELGIRYLFYDRYTPNFELSPRYHYQLVPNSRSEMKLEDINGGKWIPHRVNKHGFRGNEIRDVPDLYRVVVYGDSFIQAKFSTLPNTFTSQLEKRLQNIFGDKVEVINGGVAGYGPDQIEKKMKDELIWLKPDFVIVGIFVGNDYGDLIRNKMYRLNEEGEIEINDYTISPELERNMSKNAQQLMVLKLLKKFRDSLYNEELDKLSKAENREQYLLEFSLKKNQEQFENYVIEKDNIVRVLAQDPYNADISLYPNEMSSKYKIKLMEGVIKKIKDTAEHTSVPLLIMIIPHPMDVLGGHHSTGEVDIAKYPHYQPKILSDTVQKIAEKNGIEFVNLYDDFQSYGAENLYFKGNDDHWNDLGQEVAADIVYDYLYSNHFADKKEKESGQ